MVWIWLSFVVPSSSPEFIENKRFFDEFVLRSVRVAFFSIDSNNYDLATTFLLRLITGKNTKMKLTIEQMNAKPATISHVDLYPTLSVSSPPKIGAIIEPTEQAIFCSADALSHS